MNTFRKTTGLRRITKKLAMPLLLVGAVGAYLTVSGRPGTCPACVAVTDFIFGPNAKADIQTAETWSFPDLAGGTFHSDEIMGHVAVVTFWATWCPPCRKEIPAMNAMRERYSDKGLKVVGVSLDEGENDELASKVERLGIEYPVVRGGESIPPLFGEIRSIPTVFIFSRDNKIAFRHVGYLQEADLEKEIQKLL